MDGLRLPDVVRQLPEREPPHSSLTTRICEVKWEPFFPFTLETGLSVSRCSFDYLEPWTKKHLNSVYSEAPENSPFLLYSESRSRKEFYRQAADCFVFKDKGQIIGMFTGNASDWGTFYFRSALLLSEYQGRGLYQKFVLRLMEALGSADVPRVVVEVVPAHLGSVHIYTKLGFYITGLSTTERWGTLIQFTKFLQKSHEETYLKQFCASRT